MRSAKVATALWIAWAVVVWNVVFDRVLVLAGRRYVYDAAMAAQAGHYLLINDVMRPAMPRRCWTTRRSGMGCSRHRSAHRRSTSGLTSFGEWMRSVSIRPTSAFRAQARAWRPTSSGWHALFSS